MYIYIYIYIYILPERIALLPFLVNSLSLSLSPQVRQPCDP